MKATEIKPKRNEHVAWRVVEEEALVVNPKDSLIYPFNEVGARIWEMADGEKTTAEIIDQIEQEFDAPREAIQSDTLEFLENLREKELLEQ